MEIKVLDNRVNYYKESDSVHVLAFGAINFDTKAITKIKVEGVDTTTLSSTCGCSTSEAEGINTYTIEYKNTNILSPFSKVFILNYSENGKDKQAKIKITGNIIR
jgi:hypothetical protein